MSKFVNSLYRNDGKHVDQIVIIGHDQSNQDNLAFGDWAGLGSVGTSTNMVIIKFIYTMYN